jgi:alanine racemase
MDLGVGNTYLEVDLRKIKANTEIIKSHIGQSCELMPVIKANAAGMGLEELGLYLTGECDIKTIAVAQVYEAVRLREAGVKSELFVMGGVPYNNIPAAVKHNIQMPVFNNEFAALVNHEAGRQGIKAGLHIKIETGLNRIGVNAGTDLDVLTNYLKGLDNIKITGVFTHLAESDAADKDFSYRQFELFKRALAQLKQKGIVPKYIHVCNSAATVWFEEARYTHVRPGRILYGIDPNADAYNRLGLEVPVTWYAFVTNLKEIDEGDTLGYSRNYKAARPMRIATLSFGYADGYNKNLILKDGYVLIKGEKAPLLDMCMDQSFADVTGIKNIRINDRVTLLGKDGDMEINILDFQRMLGNAYVNAMSTIGERVKRIYIR